MVLDRREQLRYEQVMTLIESMIADNKMQPGDRLPTNKELGDIANVSLMSVRRALDALGAQVELRHATDRARPLESELVVTVGGDGTLLSASHLASPQVPMLAINSAPRSSVGFYCSATADNADRSVS